MSIRIMLGAANDKVAKQMSKFLVESGYHVVGETCDGYDLLRRVHVVYPDLVLVDYRMKGIDGYQISEIVISESLCAVIALITTNEMGHFVNLNQETLFISMVKPLNKEGLRTTIDLLVKTSKSLKALTSQVEKQTQDAPLNEQAVINQAKQLLMAHMALTEHEAHRRIQKQSMDQGVAKVKVAKLIIDMYATIAQ